MLLLEPSDDATVILGVSGKHRVSEWLTHTSAGADPSSRQERVALRPGASDRASSRAADHAIGPSF